jgi:MFS family permease
MQQGALAAVRAQARDAGDAIGRVFRNPGLRRIELAWAASIVGDWANMVAAAVYVYTQAGAAGVGILAVVRYLSVAFASPFAATLADRHPRVRVMVAADLVRLVTVGAAALVIWADGTEWAVYALAVATAVVGTAFRPAQAATLPNLARDPGELTAANVVSSTFESVGFFAGPALGGLLLAIAEIPVVYAFNAVTFVVSAALVARVRVTPDASPERTERAASDTTEDEAPSFFAETGAGFREVWGNREVRLLVGVYAAQTVVAGASGVFVVVLALETLDLGESGVGVLDSVMGIGALVGGLVALVLAQRGRLALDFGVGVLLWAAPLLLIAASPTLAVAVVAFLLVGLGNSVVDINAYTIVQRVVPDEVMGRVFGALESILIGTMALGALAMPLLIATVGMRGSLAILGGAIGVITIASLPGLRRVDLTALAPEGLPLLRGVPFLAALPERVLERLARSLVPVEVAAGRTVFAQGEAGDRFYVIERGEVEILGRRFGPGEAFGEIALLRDVPRTATVTAVTDVALQALERDVFIPAVTGHGEAEESAERVIVSRLAVR